MPAAKISAQLRPMRPHVPHQLTTSGRVGGVRASRHGNACQEAFVASGRHRAVQICGEP